jgi:hypothetical protein
MQSFWDRETGTGLDVMLRESATFFISLNYFKTRGVVGQWKTLWTSDRTGVFTNCRGSSALIPKKTNINTSKT